MTGTTKWGTGVIFVVVLVSLLISLAVSYRSLDVLVANGRWESNDQEEVLLEIKQTLSALKDAETGQLGYLVTGKEDYLEPYRKAVPRIEQYLERLTELTKDNPLQKARLAELKLDITYKLRELQQTIDVRREKGFDSAVEVVLSERGKQATDIARRMIAEVREEQDQNQGLRTALQSYFSTFCLAITLLSILVLWTRSSRGGMVASPERF